jgi:DNA-binding transcriptional LysR family regulator
VSGQVGRLRVGITNATSLTSLFPHLIHAYRTQRPQVDLPLHELSSLQQIAAVDSRDIDVGFVRLPLQVPPNELVLTQWIEEPPLVAMHAGHRLATEASIKIKDLRSEPFIAYPRPPSMSRKLSRPFTS